MSDAMRQFEERLRGYLAAQGEEAREAVRQQMWEIYGQRCAVFVSDLSGFSRLTERYSIVHFLAMICECRRLLIPVIEAAGGSPIKTAADNMYAIFPDPATAIESSIAMQRRLRDYNRGRHEDEQIGLCVGVGYGDVLVIEKQDFFGHELNLAFKLGEDTAEPGEVLVTRAAMDAAGPERFPHEARSISISGVTIPHVSVRYD
jgi:class 3 adenylate cyclase